MTHVYAPLHLDMNFESSAHILLPLFIAQRPNNKTSLQESHFKESSSLFDISAKHFSTTETSHVNWYLCKGGRSFATPFRMHPHSHTVNREVVGGYSRSVIVGRSILHARLEQKSPDNSRHPLEDTKTDQFSFGDTSG